MVLIPNTNIVVDGFKHSAELENPFYVFFLTHMHSDHYQGLSPSWNRGPIYCSPPTALMLHDRFPDIPNIFALEIGETHWVPLNTQKSKGVNVTFIDANHCIGAVMILFQGEMGTVLHTGDFRYIPSMLEHPALLDSSGQAITINHLFLDNTFCSPEYNFPPREVCTQMIIDAIDENPESDIWLAIENFGREHLLIDLSLHFNTRIVVNQSMFNRIQLLNVRPDLFSTNEEDGWIHVVSKAEMKNIIPRNKEGSSTIGIFLSGWYKYYSKDGKYFYKVPYSLHSNYYEMQTFVEKINPQKLTYVAVCSMSLKGTFELMNMVMKDKEIKDAPLQELDLQPPIKRKAGNPGKACLKKVKRPKFIGSRITSAEPPSGE
ncbi:DCLRE1B_1 [Blepharisma stoltei]|uniref:Protein artemis n=1 Tax=Blepharisma stoltei TaxID=1481888 RepID=A0AAU9IK79_9CILI|nr:unnamed protein product [Blepharisma stoltei]